MALSNDALVFGLGFLRGPRSRLSFGGETATMRITNRARTALDELIGAGYAEPTEPDTSDPGRESYRGTMTEPHLGELAKRADLDPFNLERWSSFERIAEPEGPSP